MESHIWIRSLCFLMTELVIAEKWDLQWKCWRIFISSVWLLVSNLYTKTSTSCACQRFKLRLFKSGVGRWGWGGGQGRDGGAVLKKYQTSNSLQDTPSINFFVIAWKAVLPILSREQTRPILFKLLSKSAVKKK